MILKTILFWIWSQPQTLIGSIIFLIAKIFKSKSKIHDSTSIHTFFGKYWGGISLGQFCFLTTRFDERSIKHEHGHSLQSLMLGPLYFIVIGIPSFTWATICLIKSLRGKYKNNYYSFFTEKWADFLGNVER